MEIDLLEKELDKEFKDQGVKSRAVVFGASLALLFFFVLALIFPLKNSVFSLFYSKPVSHASTLPISCTPCRADIDRNGVVGEADFTALSNCMDRAAYTSDDLGRSCLDADINGDGIVDNLDKQCLISQFGQSCSK